MLPHLGTAGGQDFQQQNDQSLVGSSGPDITFGNSSKDQIHVGDSTANTSVPVDDGKESNVGDSIRKDIDSSSLAEEQQKSLENNSLEDLKVNQAPGSNLPPQLQGEGEAITNQLLEYILQDLSGEGLDHLINRPAKRQQGKFSNFNSNSTVIMSAVVSRSNFSCRSESLVPCPVQWHKNRPLCDRALR